MNCETQILLEELISSINGVTSKLDQLNKAVNSPDGWTIGITIINAIIIIVLTICQLCLNKGKTYYKSSK